MFGPKSPDTFFVFRHRKDEGSEMKFWNIYEKSNVFNSVEGGDISVDSASLFVCGIIFREIFCPDIAFQCENEEYSLEEVWYMLCLHHEKRMGQYCIWEAIDREIERNRKNKRIVFVPMRSYMGNGVRFTNGACVKECMVLKTEIEDYHYFRNACCRKKDMDHGISGGLLLYENLIRRHVTQKGEMNCRALNLYSYVANTMIVHNMYGKYGTQKQVTLEKDPMLFLFLMAETIEPLQYGKKDLNYRVLLNAVDIELYENRMVLQPDPDYFDFEAMERKVNILQNIIGIKCYMERETSKICITM